MPPSLSREDLAPVLAHSRTGQTLREALDAAHEPRSLLAVFARYLRYDFAFGVGAAHLAAAIVVRGDLFRDPEERLGLVAHRATEDGDRSDAYAWIRVHAGPEAERFDAASKPANMALRFYAGDYPVSVKGWLLGGVSRFVEVQAAFTAGLAEP